MRLMLEQQQATPFGARPATLRAGLCPEALALLGGATQAGLPVRLVEKPHLARRFLWGSSFRGEVYVAPGLPPELQCAVLAHELAHAAQWANAFSGRGVAADEAALEAEADAVARAVLTGRPAQSRLADAGDQPRAWAEAGHYYTVYYVLLAAGMAPDKAARQAFLAQMPDEVAEFDATHAGEDVAKRRISPQPAMMGSAGYYTRLDVVVQKGLHCLTGGNAPAETARRRAVLEDANDPHCFTFGLGLHPFGDTYAHRTLSHPDTLFPPVEGHLFAGTLPDHINLRPALYLEYGQTLYDVARALLKGDGRLSREELGKDLNGFSAIKGQAGQIARIRTAAASGKVSQPMVGYAPENDTLRPWNLFQSIFHLGFNQFYDVMGLANAWASLSAATS